MTFGVIDGRLDQDALREAMLAQARADNQAPRLPVSAEGARRESVAKLGPFASLDARREAVRQRYLKGESIERIAEAFGVSVSAVKNDLYRMRRAGAVPDVPVRRQSNG